VNLRRTVLVVMGCLLMASGGCKKKDTSTSEDTGDQPNPADSSQAAPEAPATADPAATTQVPTPPVEKHEESGPAPSAHHTWVQGYWYWRGGQHQWYPGHWDDSEAAPTAAPPALQYEVAGVSPGAGYLYAPGYWRWGGTRYLWAPGHWAARRAGWGYAHPYWTFRGGRYYRSGWGWARRDAAWDRRYGGWRAHGDVWVQPHHYNEYVRRGHNEGWGRHYR